MCLEIKTSGLELLFPAFQELFVIYVYEDYFLHYLRKAISLTVSRSADVHSNAFKGVCFSGPLFVLLLQFCPTIALTMHVFDV